MHDNSWRYIAKCVREAPAQFILVEKRSVEVDVVSKGKELTVWDLTTDRIYRLALLTEIGLNQESLLIGLTLYAGDHGTHRTSSGS